MPRSSFRLPVELVIFLREVKNCYYKNLKIVLFLIRRIICSTSKNLYLALFIFNEANIRGITYQTKSLVFDGLILVWLLMHQGNVAFVFFIRKPDQVIINTVSGILTSPFKRPIVAGIYRIAPTVKYFYTGKNTFAIVWW